MAVIGSSRRQPWSRYKCFVAVYYFVIYFATVNEAHGQLVTTSDQIAKEGDAEVVITCDYSQFTSTAPLAVQWDELDENGTSTNIVNYLKIENGRFKLNKTHEKAELLISQPMRSDSKRIFKCEVQEKYGNIEPSNPATLTVYYLDQPLLDASASTVYEGQSVTFTCSIPDGDPIPHITWYIDGQTVNTNNPSRYEITNNSTGSILKIKSVTGEDDAGRYTCKAESDQFKGEDAKTSGGKGLNIIVYYINVTYEYKSGFATCTAEGHPKPSSVLILQDGEEVKKENNTATIEINDEICQSNLTCYAENGNLNKTMTLENCTEGISEDSGSLYIILVVLIVCLLLWILLLVYFMYYKNIEWNNTDINTVTVEGGEPVMMSWKYRPSIARFKTFEITKEDKVLGSNQKQFSSCKTVCQFVCYCCAYFCGFFCIEYCDKSFEYNIKDKMKHLSSSGSGEEYWMMVTERERPDGAEVPAVVIKSSLPKQTAGTEETAALPKSGEITKTNTVDEGSELLAEHQETSAKDLNERSKTSYSVATNGRGRISLTVSNPVRSDSGEYNCNIEGSRQQYTGVNNLSVYWIEMVAPKYSTKRDVSNVEMKCRYGPSDMPLICYKWKKIRKDGTTEIEDCEKDSRFEVTSCQNNILSLKIKNVILGDAGMYQCEVKPVNGGQILKDTTHLTVKEDAIKIDIPDVITNESLNVKLFLNLTYVDDSAAISNVTWYKHFEDEAKERLTSLQPPYSTPRCQSAYEDKSKVYLKINNVESEDARKYTCEVQVEGRQKIYKCFGRLEVQGPVLTMENKELHTVEGGNARIPFYVSPIQKQINKFIFYKFEKEIADSLTIFRRFKIKYSEDKLTGFLEISNVKSSDAGDYRCKCVIEGKDVYSTKSRLEVTKAYIRLNDGLVMNGEKAVLTCKYGLDNQVKYVNWYKKTGDESQEEKIEKVPERCKVTHDRLNQTSLEFQEVTLADAGEYICELTTATEITKGKLSETHTSSAHLHVQYIKLNDCLATHGDKAVLTCKYGIENQVKYVNWYKKTADQDIMIFTSDKSQEKKIKKAPEGCKAIFKENESSLVFEQVSLADAGEYMCKVKEKLPSHTASAHLHVQCDVFTEQVKTRHPAVVFINSHFIIFCEENNSDVIMRRGKLNGKSLIEWKKAKIIFNEKETCFQNLVPIVTDKENGKMTLMCVRQNNNTKERKIIRMKSDDNGVNWTEPEDVQLDLKGLPIYFISLGDGVCLHSGKLVVAGVWTLKDNESIEKKLFVMTGTNDGDTWDIVTAVKSPYATLGGHTQVFEYANDNVYISCSLEDCKQRFRVYGDEGFRTFNVKTEDAQLETNPECQGGIVRLPTKTNQFYQIAMASHGNETKDLTLHLSEDGCKTWCQFNTLGAVNAEESDLAYYSVKEGKEEAKGIVCVYSYSSETEGYKIGMQLISNKEIMLM
ncbi:uncharacterized protein [Antedon mediterranea]|uniref:uncharacterized protein n=1 Tax=Antedon mediterranea TaxID=105859 RepID=UPI003AF4B9E6